MTSIEVPYSIAAALPTLSVMDITNEVAQTVARSDRPHGIAYISATSGLSLIRVQERETGFFEDLECLLERVVPSDAPSRERLVYALLGSRTGAGAVHRRPPLPWPVAARHALLARRRAPHRLVVDLARLERADRPGAAGSVTSLPMLVLTRADVEELLDLDELVGALARAHEELSSGAVSMPPRIAALDGRGLLGAMPAYLPSAGLGCKLVTLFPHNTDRPTHQAAIVLFDPENGSPVALIDGTYITATRTAAAAALAARLLARADAKVLAIIGTGVQARSHVRAFAPVRDWTEIRIAGRDPAKTAALAAELGARAQPRSRMPCAAPTSSPRRRTRPSPSSAPSGSRPGPTSARSATTRRDRSSIPSSCARRRSSSSRATRRSRRRPGGAPELAGVDPASVAELGELVSGTRRGRTTPVEITLYKSVGVAVQDLAAAALVLAAAREREVGLEIELEEIHA